MGMHTARRSSSKMTSVAGRGLFTATAAFALIGGGAGMAFAGEAPADNAGHHNNDGEHHGNQNDNGCIIDVVDPTLTDVEMTADETAGTGSVTDAANEATAPIHDAVCPPLDEVVETTPLGDPSGDGDSLATPVTGGVADETDADAPADTPAAPAGTPAEVPAASTTPITG